MLVKRLKPIPVEAVVRGYLAGSGWKEYQDNQAVCGVKLPAGLKNASQLPEPIYTPAAKAAVGEHDENITFEQTVAMIGADLDGTPVLMDEVLTPDSSRYWPADSYLEGANPPSYDKQFLRDWLESAQVNGKPWDKTPPAPRLPREVIENTAAKYEEAMKKLMG
jgi:phosphoribosylaminoimidazole-succinocarboxamide synthase